MYFIVGSNIESAHALTHILDWPQFSIGQKKKTAVRPCTCTYTNVRTTNNVQSDQVVLRRMFTLCMHLYKRSDANKFVSSLNNEVFHRCTRRFPHPCTHIQTSNHSHQSDQTTKLFFVEYRRVTTLSPMNFPKQSSDRHPLAIGSNNEVIPIWTYEFLRFIPFCRNIRMNNVSWLAQTIKSCFVACEWVSSLYTIYLQKHLNRQQFWIGPKNEVILRLHVFDRVNLLNAHSNDRRTRSKVDEVILRCTPDTTFWSHSSSVGPRSALMISIIMTIHASIMLWII